MSSATRPLASTQRKIIGRAKLVDISTEVELIAKSVDLITGRPFYIVNGPVPFGVWREELFDIAYCQPIGA